MVCVALVRALGRTYLRDERVVIVFAAVSNRGEVHVAGLRVPKHAATVAVWCNNYSSIEYRENLRRGHLLRNPSRVPIKNNII